MIQFIGHLQVSRPPEEVFRALADMAVLSQWNPNVAESRLTEGEHLQVGSRYASEVVRGPIRLTARSVLVAVEPNHSVRYEGSIGSFWSIDSLIFQPTEGGTRVTFLNETRTPAWMRPLTPLLNATFQRQAAKAVEGARQYLAEQDSL